jgi:(p)ppGpp synthase/HD superfamily hydrolase
MSTLETAIRIAVTAHVGQLDKGGAAYITHPLRLMAAVDGEEAKIVAVLHDVVEDTAVTLRTPRNRRRGTVKERLPALQERIRP